MNKEAPNPPPKILLVSEPGSDGVFRHVEGLARFLLRQGLTVGLAYSSRRKSNELQALVRDIENAGGPTVDLAVGNSPELLDIRASLRLRRFALEFRPDVVHAHSSKAGALTRLQPWPEATRIFYTPHAYYGLRRGSYWRDGLYNRLERWLGRHGTTINVSGSEAGFAKHVLGIPRERQVTIANGVDTVRFHPASPEQKAAARLQLGLPSEGLILLSLARLSLQKDPHTLYRGFARARELGAPVHLLHVGTGPNPRYAQDLITPALSPHVTRIAHLSDTAPAYLASDGLILTSLYEGLSLAALEAAACNLPLLLTNVGGNDDLADFGLDDTHLFPCSNPEAAGQAIARWASHRRAVRNHRQIAETLFSETGCYSAVLRLYQGAPEPLDRPSPHPQALARVS